MACEYGQGYCMRLSRKVGEVRHSCIEKRSQWRQRQGGAAAETVKGVICHGGDRTALVEGKSACCRAVKAVVCRM